MVVRLSAFGFDLSDSDEPTLEYFWTARVAGLTN
jgi:hypothetical protein